VPLQGRHVRSVGADGSDQVVADTPFGGDHGQAGRHLVGVGVVAAAQAAGEGIEILAGPAEFFSRAVDAAPASADDHTKTGAA